jgi:phytoene synthase
MDPDDYCAARGPRAGSSFYYAVRFAPDRKRCLALYALIADLYAIASSVSDANVAAAKLAWWQQEIGALREGSGSHPITRALAAHGFSSEAAVNALLRASGAVGTDLTQTRFLDDRQLLAYCSAAGGAPLQAYAMAKNIVAVESLTALDDLGSGIALARLLLRVGEDGRKGRIYLPHEELRKFQVPAADILGARQSTALAALAAAKARQSTELLDKALAALRHEKRLVRPALILGRLYRALLEASRDDGFKVALHRVSLTPLRKFATAWRTSALPW